MAHLFKILKDKSEYSSITGSALIVKNVSGGPFEVDAEGRTLSANFTAAVDGSCKICADGIASGKLMVVHEVVKQQSPKQKPKAINLSPEPAKEEANDNQQTVASTQDAESVQ